jgi:biopolymer transport protein TolQ
MQNDLQIWQLILEASWMVKMVMLILLAASVTSWMIIFRKRQALAAAEKGANVFEERFWSGTDLTHLYESVSRNNTGEGLEQIFESGFKEFSRMREQDV